MSEHPRIPALSTMGALNDASNKINSAMFLHISNYRPEFINEMKAHYKVATLEGIFKSLQNEFVDCLESHTERAGSCFVEEKVTKKQLLEVAAYAKQIAWHDPRQMGEFYKNVCEISGRPIVPKYKRLTE